MDIGERIKARREELGMSQDELARKVGYTSRTTVNKIENGANNLRQTKIAEFAKALNCSPAYLMGWVSLEEEQEDNTYYIDEEAKKIAQMMFENESYQVLFDAVKNVKPEDIDKVAQMIKLMIGE